MLKKTIIIPFVFLILFTGNTAIQAQETEAIHLQDSTEKIDLYPYMDVIKIEDNYLTIEDVTSLELSSTFQPIQQHKQKQGFFKRVNWLRFEVINESNKSEWLLEFAFPLINHLQLYTETDDQAEKLYDLGAEYPFHQREMDNRHFVMNVDIEPGDSKVFYAMAIGSGDLHPPIAIWDQESYVEKSQKEFLLLGIFYGIVIVMILYNLFLYFSLRIKSYLYYVIAIICTLFGKLSINGLAFQYIWPDYPAWNLVAATVWVPLACISILVFSREFLEVDRYLPSFKKAFYLLISLNILVIISIPISRYVALYLMVSSALLTFLITLSVAVICLIKGARQARFYIFGWIIFLIGVSITILERAVILPFTMFTEYAGQAALTIEVVLLSLALADKISIMRQEKEQAEITAQESQTLAMENLKKADKLKDEFLAVTSHELRTPLYGMIGIAESLRDGISGNLSKGMKSQLSMIISSGERLTHLVNEILDFSKLKYDSLDLEFKPVDVEAIANIVIAVSNPLLKDKNIQLISVIPANLPSVRADENRLQQILHNIVDNAIKYTDQGKIVIDAVAEDNEVTIKVIDTGYGMTKDQLDIIFEPFQQGKSPLTRNTGGIGIGLNITKTLVDLHDGELNVLSKIGEGSTFTITLPIHDEDLQTKEAAATTEAGTLNEEPELQYFPQSKGEHKPKIVVCDDEIVNLQVLINQLSLNNYEVFTTTKGEDVLQLVEEHDIDLLILDIMMPGISGYEVCQTLREKYSVMELPILMLTARNQLQDKLISFEAGANDYLVKPCDKEELLSRVKTLVHIKLLNQEIVEMNLQLEEKILERTHELHIANEDLQAAEHSRKKLLANIAHELGTPVTLIHNYVQSIQQGIIEKSDTHYQKLVKDKINVLNRLIEDLFLLSSDDPGEINLNYKKVRLDQWIKRLFTQSEFIVSQEQRIFKHSPIPKDFKSYYCQIDQERTDQLFINLLSNAIESTAKHHGVITLDTEILTPDHLSIRIHDNGIGIHEEDLPYIFDRFYRTNTEEVKNQGTGLGLAIVKQMIEKHEGKIEVESIKNQGTTFTIIFPIKSKSPKKEVSY